MTQTRPELAVALAAFALMAFPAMAEERPELGLPLACEPHKTCFIQNYVDDAKGSEVRDFACGTAAYDAHKGTDFRLLSARVAADGVPVLASAPGVVKALRDSMPDIFLRDMRGALAERIKGVECGNGVVLDHGGGWETQYCHLKKGSVVAVKGQTVQRGDKLGEVGYSGMADFAHVHLSVRHNDQVVDPFLPDSNGEVCVKDAKGPGLWQPAVADAFPYRNGEILAAGFGVETPDWKKLEADHTAVAPPMPQSQALIFYVRFMNLKSGDRTHLIVSGPDGPIAERTGQPLAHSKAIYLEAIGAPRRADAWKPGRYEGRIEILREGEVYATASGAFEMPAAR